MNRFLTVILSFFLLLSSVLPVLGKQSVEDSPIPEKNGDYADPQHPGVRVRVFVHEPKSIRPTPAPVCTDSDSTAIVGWAGWKLPVSHPWIYNLNPQSVPASVGSGSLATIADLGFAGQWQPATNRRVNFQKGPNTTKDKSAYDGQNIIAWGRTSGSALAVTYIRYTGRVVLDVDTIMNLKFPWNWTTYGVNVCGNSNSYDAQAVLTHEQGHWLGLDDEYASAYVNNTMYGYGLKGDIKADTLTSGDKSGIALLYP